MLCLQCLIDMRCVRRVISQCACVWAHRRRRPRVYYHYLYAIFPRILWKSIEWFLCNLPNKQQYSADENIFCINLRLRSASMYRRRGWFYTTRRSSLGDRAFPVAGARACNALPPMHVSSASSVCLYSGDFWKLFCFSDICDINYYPVVLMCLHSA